MGGASIKAMHRKSYVDYLTNGRQHHLSMARRNQWTGPGGSSDSETAEGVGSFEGKCLWKAFTAPTTPSSFSICLPSSIAHSFTSGSSMNFIALDSCSTLSSDIGIGAGPTPLACILSPQKNWSPKKGTTVVGHPALNPAAVVPAPPWCTTAVQRGNNQS
ncbi:hypothetical protein HPP92_007696 [Vanilla planifolia]|uniref:Uncharacterized protein n=1 Tax=Vanilla planifolia TaxID=51239 RepID=A0A835RRE4_VANPL|nr:hypothetical protein HPP92_007696 [Vanilla planifolia]